MAGAPLQLALALEHRESFAREDFLSGPSNAAGLALVEQWPDWPSGAMVLTGPQGSGKSHLASIWAASTGARFLSGRALARNNPPMALATGALVLEDLAGGEFDEAALFHLLNLAREERAFVLLTTRSAPATWTVMLRDLESRLKALPVVNLASPDDALLRAVIGKLFADRQLTVDAPTLDYLMHHIERSFSGAQSAVETLDREALRRKRPLTRVLAAEVFRDDG